MDSCRHCSCFCCTCLLEQPPHSAATVPAFVHLRLHSEFSVVDGLCRIDAAVEAAARDRQGALALTDSANLFGAVRFYKAARAAGVKPIVGCDVWLTNELERDNPHRLLLLVQDEIGLPEPLRTAVARLAREPASRPSRTAQRVADGRERTRSHRAVRRAARRGRRTCCSPATAPQRVTPRVAYAAVFPRRFYVELQRAGQPGIETYVNAALALAIELDLPVVATHPVQFIARDDFRAHEARVCIAEGYTLADPRRPRRFNESQYFKSQAEMAELFADIPAALDNAVEIARRCNLKLTLGKARLPDFPTPPGVTLDAYCRQLAYDGLERRLAVAVSGRGCARRATPDLRRAPRLRARDDREDGLLRLLPDRRGLHQLGQEQRHPGGPGPRLGRRLAGGVLARASPISIRCATTCCSSAS